MGKLHLDAIQRSGVARVTSLVDPDRAAADLAKRHSLDWFVTISDMLASNPPDGIIVATPNQMHVENGLECVRAGLPILLEKPIADDAHSALRLVEEAENASVPILVGHHRRHNPLVQAAKAQIDSGAIGEVVAAQLACWFYKPDSYFDVTWRTQPGAGPVLLNLIHDVDLLRYLIGEVRSVQAIESMHARGHAVEDTAAIILRMANGALATMTISDSIVSPWNWELTSEENPAFPATGQSCCFIGGTRGAIEIPGGQIWSQTGERSWWRPVDRASYDVERQDPWDRQIAHFCDVITGRADPLVSGREALKSLQVIEAIKDSARSDRTADLSDVT